MSYRIQNVGVAANVVDTSSVCGAFTMSTRYPWEASIHRLALPHAVFSNAT